LIILITNEWDKNLFDLDEVSMNKLIEYWYINIQKSMSKIGIVSRYKQMYIRNKSLVYELFDTSRRCKL
jgi:hypothetical protein